ncbi:MULTISPECIES: glycosyltransferase family 2 protein [Thermodesulfovibrio]|jgi:cellulose synthase (UDP-forming)|uniref:glycosyltransferase family 2 protein n=1 Tax=Thermodesulfovibrio TaxID=28261 RepID=UPI00261E030D|nr:glycosyltransferase family 2 protein [Thermodesulfovibrio sp.]
MKNLKEATLKAFFTLIILVVIFTGLSVYLDTLQQAVLAYIFLALSYVLMKFNRNNETVRVLILSLAVFITLRYWIFRTFHTLGYTGFFDSMAMLSLYLAETYAIVIYFLGIFVNISPLKRHPLNLPEDKNILPSVDIFIPTYNEPLEIIKTTIIACKQIKYPQDKINIFILDDGSTTQKRNDREPEKALQAWQRYEELKSLAKEMDVNYITREKNEHAKAGNLNNALWLTSKGFEGYDTKGSEWFCFGKPPSKGGELILVLDCDHVPTVDILEKTVGFFLRDDKLFLVQTPHFFINPTPIERNLGTYAESPGENEMFYGEIHRGLDFWNSSFFCGSGALLRRKYLEEVGGFAGKTITEDAETSLTLHSKGYRSVYLKKPLICGLSPETFDDFITQRSRWTQGMIQIFMLKNPLKQKGLRWYQKLCYLNNCIFWFFGLARIIFIFAPLMYLLFNLRVYNVSTEQIITYAIPHLACSLSVSNYLYGRVRHPFFSEVLETAQSFFLIFPTIGAILNPLSPTFRVTPKGTSLKESTINSRVFTFYILLILCLIGIYAGINKWLYSPLERGAVAVCMAWTLFNLSMIIACIGALYELRQIRRYHRILVEEEALLIIPEKLKSLKATITDISMGGLGLRVDPRDYIPLLNSKIEIVTWNSQGREFRFRVELKRVSKNGNMINLGVSFDLTEDEGKIISYVYGDSGRWERFWSKRDREKGILAGFLYLLKIGFIAMGRNIRGVIKFIFSASKRLFKYKNLGEIWKGYNFTK